MPGLIVRDATPADVRLIEHFHRALYLKHRDTVMPAEITPLFAHRDFDEVLRQDARAVMMREGGVVVIAEADGVPIGYGTGYVEVHERRLLRRRGHIEDWYVDEDRRGQGHGRAILEGLVERFRRAGCEVVESSTWAFNTGARRAHEALGFAETEVKYRMRIEAE